MKWCPECGADVEGLLYRCDCCGASLEEQKNAFLLAVSTNFPNASVFHL